jgi:hypothetical protein
MKHQKDIVDFTTGELKTVNNGFVQLYEDNIDLIIEIANEHPTAIKVFLFLIKNMDEKNALVISQNALSESLNLHRNTIGNSISYLKEKKALDVFKSGNTNIYAVNSQLAWKSNVEGKRYAMFSAKVFITASEQEEIYKTQLLGHAIKVPKKKKTTIKSTVQNFDKKASKIGQLNLFFLVFFSVFKAIYLTQL